MIAGVCRTQLTRAHGCVAIVGCRAANGYMPAACVLKSCLIATSKLLTVIQESPPQLTKIF